MKRVPPHHPSVPLVTAPKFTQHYTEVGSYRGCVFIGRKWFSASNLNYVEKTGSSRFNGPATPAMIRAMKDKPIDFKPFFKKRIIAARKE